MLTHIKKYRFEIFTLAPLVLFLFFFTLLPIAHTIILSLSRNGVVGLSLAHFKTLFGHNDFLSAIGNTLFIALASLSIELLLGLFLALITSSSRMFRLMRPLFILPIAIPTVVVGTMMSYMFATSGWLNIILSDLSLIAEPIHWMSGGTKSLIMITLADSWKVTPLVMLILLAGLASIDRSLYEAARIDGASRFTTFRRITLPLLMPYITMAIIIRGIDAFKIFALPLILMGENCKVIGTYAYLEYNTYNNVHLSAASAVVLLGILLALVSIYIGVMGKKGLDVY